MNQSILIDLDLLFASMTVCEEGEWHQYLFTLTKDRSDAVCTRIGLDEQGKELFSITKTATLENYKEEFNWSPIILWLAKGMWGVPLEFGREQKDAADKVRSNRV